MRTKAIMEPAPHLSAVYFDDYTVTYTPTNIVQSNEYYPYGLQTASSWTRENATQNNFLANGGTELNTTSQLYDLDFRNYDPALGRMHQTDPMADKYGSLTTYNYANNNPAYYNDKNGAECTNTGSPSPSHWSRDMEEISNGNKPSHGTDVLNAYQDSWDVYDHFGMEETTYGFGDLYLSPSQKIDERDRVDNFWKNVMSAFHGAANKEEIYGQNRHGDYGIWLKTTFRDTPSFTKGTFDGIVVLNRFLKWNGGHGDDTFEGITLHDASFGVLKHGVAFTTPLSGITFSFDYYKGDPKTRKDLLRHEFGHILQYRRYGGADYTVVAITSLFSAGYAASSLEHQQNWTENQANTLSFLYFGMPSDWNRGEYPIDENYMNAVIKANFFKNFPIQ